MATTRALATAFLAACATATGPLVTVKNGTYEGLHAPGYGQDYFLGYVGVLPSHLRHASPRQSAGATKHSLVLRPAPHLALCTALRLVRTY